MKKLLYIFLASVSFVGCSDLLDTEPHDKYTADVVWGNATLAQYFIYDTYVDISEEIIDIPGSLNSANLGAAMESYTDNISSQNGDDISQSKFTITSDFGWDKFDLIRQANVVIEEAGNATALEESTRLDMVGQGKFLRAFIYFKLARMYGRAVIVDRPLTADDDFYIPRTETIKETYDFIINDLQEAAVDLFTDVKSSKIGKGAAYALLAEVALQAAAYCESGTSEYYQIAKDASEALFALNKYSLADYYSIFNDFSNAINNTEIIFAHYVGKDQTQCYETPIYRLQPGLSPSKQHADVDPKVTCTTAGVGVTYNPSQDFVNDYLVADTDGKAKRWKETSYYQDYLEGKATAADVLYNHADARLDATIVRDSSYYAGSLMYTRIGGNIHNASGASGSANSIKNYTGYLYRKGMHDTEELIYATYCDYHYVFLRLGRSYLNYAEACYRTGDYTTAIEYINMTRDVHGELPGLDSTATAEEIWEAYKIERRVELFFEGDRYWSLLRWYKADGIDDIPELNKDLRYTNEISADGKEIIEDVEMTNANIQASAYLVWNKKRFLYPVPQAYIDESGGVIDQTEGW